MNYKQIILKRGKEDSLLRFHPWIFSGAIAHIDQPIDEGEVVRVLTHDKRFIAVGHYQIGSIAVRVLSFNDITIDTAFWKRRLEAALSVRQTLGVVPEAVADAPTAGQTAASQTRNTIYRLVHGEGDNLPGLVVDCYGRTAVMQAHSVGMHLCRKQVADALAEVMQERIDKARTRLQKLQQGDGSWSWFEGMPGSYYMTLAICEDLAILINSEGTKGLDVEANPMESAMSGLLETVYEDESLVVVNKPTGMLSIPGKGEQPSVYSILRERYPDAEEPMIVHRLDMATSGLLVVAKTKNAHQNLQRQFYEHTVVKRYIAIVEGVPVNQKGTIVLPMRPDPLNRPYQVVDMEHGKQAITDFEVLSVSDGQSRVVLYPHTGRTHQLRVHCAHPDGLHAPIVGDHLYGTPANRLYLHAEYLEFTHPVNDKRLQFYAEGF